MIDIYRDISFCTLLYHNTSEVRGVQHHQCLIYLPNVLETGLFGRIIQDGRVIRQEMKMGNISPERRDVAWETITMGLLA